VLQDGGVADLKALLQDRIAALAAEAGA
jgi:hypothetical protein